MPPNYSGIILLRNMLSFISRPSKTWSVSIWGETYEVWPRLANRFYFRIFEKVSVILIFVHNQYFYLGFSSDCNQNSAEIFSRVCISKVIQKKSWKKFDSRSPKCSKRAEPLLLKWLLLLNGMRYFYLDWCTCAWAQSLVIVKRCSD